ncbi:hypothetical protein GRI97_09205 [Altererythrobacter xixiisoli]|uniref:Peptidase C-terminal archaeal/bacterial domain-containing protein n=1 Tax=Croceibacterium xixiisoli TaxID=1476466 RepID=A0A6I4TSP0_9SPHN|nr:hypothetical protein [Croceibacterium xixiisoli]MXO99165.1 hypothetical protein [Croceibacterium xixiisoli]
MGRFRSLSAAATIAMLSVISVSAGAQNVRDLDGQDGDVRVYQGEVKNAPTKYQVTVPANSALEIVAAATTQSQLDPYLKVRNVADGETLSEDDDSAGNLGARVYVFAENEMRVEIEVSAAEAADDNRKVGKFELSVRPTDWRPTPPRTITFGSRSEGRLINGESHVFHIQGQKDQRLVATLRAADGSALDSMLELRRGNATSGETLAEDDDSAGGTNGLDARIRRVLPANGTYTLVARGLGTTSGAYTLEIGDGAQRAAVPAVRELSLGVRATGQFGADEAISDDDGDEQDREIIYRLSADAKRTLRSNPGTLIIRMNTASSDSEIDPMLDLALETPLGRSIVASDDDSGGNLNAELSVDLSALRSEPDWLDRVRIVARTLNAVDGDFTIEAVRGQ